MVGVVNLAVLACVLTATTKKGRKLFSRKKVHPRENPGYAYVSLANVSIACDKFFEWDSLQLTDRREKIGHL